MEWMCGVYVVSKPAHSKQGIISLRAQIWSCEHDCDERNLDPLLFAAAQCLLIKSTFEEGGAVAVICCSFEYKQVILTEALNPQKRFLGQPCIPPNSWVFCCYIFTVIHTVLFFHSDTKSAACQMKQEGTPQTKVLCAAETIQICLPPQKEKHLMWMYCNIEYMACLNQLACSDVVDPNDLWP